MPSVHRRHRRVARHAGWSVHPRAIAYLNKKLDLPRFDQAAEFLAHHAIDLRVFVLYGTPYVPAAEQVEWTKRTAEYAAQRGAALVAIIPVRGGNGEMERLQAAGEFTPPTRYGLERAVDACAGIHGPVISADPWDLERLPE
jgi:archaeosine synthase beta-subunit